MLPKVSIIIPVYNAEKYLCQCFDSICKQTLESIEVIIVDDGSTDKSYKILNDYATKDKRFIVLQQNHQGPGKARNWGVEVAQGEYLGFIDADDWIDNDYFEKLYFKAIDENADVCCALKRRDVYDTNIVETVTPWHNDLYFTKKQLVLTAGHLWSKIFKREFVINHKLKNVYSRRTQDIAFSVPAILLAQSIGYVDDACYNYRVLETSTSHQKLQDTDFEEVKDIFTEILAHDYSPKDKIIVYNRLQSLIQYYTKESLIKQKIILFKTIRQSFPEFNYIGDNKFLWKIATLL